MNSKGFTLIEFLVAMTIMLALLTMASISFQRISNTVRVNTSSSQFQMDSLSAVELLRLDLEHAGLGIASYINTVSTGTANDVPLVSWDGTSLATYSTLDNTNSNTWGWAVGSCAGSFDWGNAIEPNDDDYKASKKKTSTLLLSPEFIYDSTATPTSCGTGTVAYVAYPYDSTGTNGCTGFLGGSQKCTRMSYTLSGAQTIGDCASETRNLLRNNSPLFTCVAGFQVRFDWDKNGNGILETSEKNLDPTKTSDIPASELSKTVILRQKLKNVKVYILQQEGKRDDTYTFSQVPDTSGDIDFTMDGETITFTTNFDDADKHKDFIRYHWRLISVTGIPREFNP